MWGPGCTMYKHIITQCPYLTILCQGPANDCCVGSSNCTLLCQKITQLNWSEIDCSMVRWCLCIILMALEVARLV